MRRYKHILGFGRTLFIWCSAIGFWYMVMPVHYIDLIVRMITFGIIFGIAFIIIGNVVAFTVSLLHKRYKWARVVFNNPGRRMK
jgi:hypothetical protein